MNLGVDFVTKSPDAMEEGHTQFIWDVEVERHFENELTYFLEGYTDETGVPAVSTALQYELGEHFNAFVAVSYDREGTYSIRPGINIPFEDDSKDRAIMRANHTTTEPTH